MCRWGILIKIRYFVVTIYFINNAIFSLFANGSRLNKTSFHILQKWKEVEIHNDYIQHQ